jgi:hypothetical protein
MSVPEPFLNRAPDELERYLLQQARSEVAPAGARDRAWLEMASAGVGVSLVTGALTHGATRSATKALVWLVVKWVVVGMTSGVLAVASAERIQRLVDAPPPLSLQEVGGHSKNAAPKRSPEPAGSVATPPSTPAESEVQPPAPAGRLGSAPAALRSNGAAPEDRAASPATQDSALVREVSQLDRARQALAWPAPQAAWQALDDYQRDFPAGALRAEAAALRVEAAGQMGNTTLAIQLAHDFLAHYPTHPSAVRVRALADQFSAQHH